MNDGTYPHETELDTIRNWDCFDLDGLMEYIKPYWNKYGKMTRHGDLWIMATGGWSGNEDIISAMKSNDGWWLMHWQSSERGGGFTFKKP